MKFEDYFLKIAQSCCISILKMIYKMTNKLKFIANDWVSLRIRAGSMTFFANDINSNVMLNEIPIWWSIPAENNNNVQMSIKCAGLINEMLPLFCVGFKYPWKNFLCSVLLISNLTQSIFWFICTHMSYMCSHRTDGYLIWWLSAHYFAFFFVNLTSFIACYVHFVVVPLVREGV